MSKKLFAFLLVIFLFFGVLLYLKRNTGGMMTIPQVVKNIVQPTPTNSLQVLYLREKSYPGSDLKIEETLDDGSNYKRYIASYYSEGLKIYGLLTIPKGDMPSGGFPAIIFNHGYITPEAYTPTGNYVAYVDAFARSNYVVFKPDYRGNGKSDGEAGSAYFSSNYDIDDLNATSSIKRNSNVNPNKIGVWGHSLGGHITLVDMVVTNDIKVAVIWGGVVGSYQDIIYNWQRRVTYQPNPEDLRLRNALRQELLNQYGTPTDNPDFWNSIDPTSNLNFVNIPVQIHVGAADEEVPVDFSESLYNRLKSLGKTVEFYSYPDADHNISQGFNLAMKRSVAFFDKYLK
ncbi:MAG TPA: alpha/beta fold hydrolase [Candidatus Saccharimonadales bacterium]|nr:alpha/beta fold hydrolase [Candidatus Saccharimonadales bacterium]